MIGMSRRGLMYKNMLKGHANSFIDAHGEYCRQVYTTTHKVQKDTDKRYDDEVDNVCSNKTLMEKYPHLIPRDLSKFSTGKDLDRNNLDIYDDITRRKNRGTYSNDNCWMHIVENLPIQSPGIWLHP